MDTLTASIGLIQLIPSLRITPNYKVVSGDVLNVKKSVLYVNEKNKYGSSRPLQKNALMLLLYLHFQAPDSNGLVLFSVSEAAETLHCHERSIRNNMKVLAKRQFITYQQFLCSDIYQAFLLRYTDYFIPADQGGRGYVTLTKEFFEELLVQKHINQIRLILRSYINEMKPKDKENDEQWFTIRSLRRYVPRYETSKHINELLNSHSYKKIFSTSGKGSQMLKNSVNDTYNATSIRDQLKSDCYHALEALVQKLQPEEGNDYKRHFHLSATQYDDISAIAYLYPIPFIIESLQKIYHQYYERFLEPENLGALVRSYVQIKAMTLSVE